MPIGDIFEHKSEAGKFVVQTGPSPEDYRVAGNINEARLIKQQLTVQEQNAATRANVAEAGVQPEVQQAVSEAGTEARADLGNMAINAAPSLAAGAATGGLGFGAGLFTKAGITGLLARAGAQGGAELVRQKIQGEPTDLGAAGTSAALSGGVDVGSATLRGMTQGLMKKSPGVMHRISEQARLDALENISKSGMTVDKAGVRSAYENFDNLIRAQGASNVALNKTSTHLKDVIAEMEMKPASEQSAKILSIFNKIQTTKQNVTGTSTGARFTPFNEVADLMAAIESAKARATTPNERRLLIQAKNAIYEDIDNASVFVAQKDALRKATSLAREAFAKGDLNDAIEAGTTNVSNVIGKQVINPKTVLDNIYKLKRDDPMFTKSFKPGELDKVVTMFEDITKKLRGTSAEGTAIVLGGMGGMGGTAAASVLGANPGFGAAMGAAAGVSTPGLFTKLALNDKMRPYLLRMVGEGKELNGATLNILAGLFKPSVIANTAIAANKEKPKGQ